jgi:hypothetical protein
VRIGIDFDNTIACYDGVFHRAALERGLVPPDLATSKNAVREHLNGSGRSADFTGLQGYVYGSRMDLVAPYPGVADFIRAARRAKHLLYIVSHKTRYPILGPRFDMHASARGFLESQGFVGPAMLPAENVFFEENTQAKVARATALGVDAFIDDLPEILGLPGFPVRMQRILFDPEGQHEGAPLEASWVRCSDWMAIRSLLLGGARC